MVILTVNNQGKDLQSQYVISLLTVTHVTQHKPMRVPATAPQKPAMSTRRAHPRTHNWFLELSVSAALAPGKEEANRRPLLVDP